MYALKIKIFLIFNFIFLFVANAQVQALFNSKTQYGNMTLRWELDSTAQRGTFLLSPYKPIYILPVDWSSAPN